MAQRALDCCDALGLDHFVRISGDSPFMPPELIDRALETMQQTDADITTNVFPRSYPAGASVEAIKAGALRRAHRDMSESEREHVTAAIYKAPAAWRIVNFAAAAPAYSGCPADRRYARRARDRARYDGAFDAETRTGRARRNRRAAAFVAGGGLNASMSDLALLGGTPVLSEPLRRYRSMGEAEAAAVAEVIASDCLSGFYGSPGDEYWGGPKVLDFEAAWRERYGVAHAISVNSATSGLFAAMGAIGLSPGDEVIVPAWTMSATAMAPLVYGGIPIFADIEAETFGLDPEAVAQGDHAAHTRDPGGQPVRPSGAA